MGRLNYFITGASIGGIILLNQTYENERLKETLQAQADERRTIQSMVSLTIFNTQLGLV